MKRIYEPNRMVPITIIQISSVVKVFGMSPFSALAMNAG